MISNRISLRLSVILAVFLLAVPWIVNAQAAGASNTRDPNNPSYLLEILEDGESAEGLLTVDVTAQLFGFLGSAGDTVTISMTQEADSSLDPYLVLLGPAGQVVAKDDDGGKTAFSAQISKVELPANGSYFIIASSFRGINATFTLTDAERAAVVDETFTITVNGITAPPEDESQYFSSRLVLDEPFDGYSTPQEPVYFFTYVATAGEVVDVTLTSEQFDTLVMVFGPGGNRIAANDDGESIGTNSSVTGVVLEEAEKYLVFATDVAFPNAGDEDAALKYKGGDFVIELSAGTPLLRK